MDRSLWIRGAHFGNQWVNLRRSVQLHDTKPGLISPKSCTAFMLSLRLAIQYTVENAEEAYLTLLRGPNVSSAMTSLTEPLRESRRSNFRSACWPASSVWLLALMKDLEVAMLSELESGWQAALLVLKLHWLLSLVHSSSTIFLWFLYSTTGRDNVVEFSGSVKSVTLKSRVSVDLITGIFPLPNSCLKTDWKFYSDIKFSQGILDSAHYIFRMIMITL